MEVYSLLGDQQITMISQYMQKNVSNWLSAWSFGVTLKSVKFIKQNIRKVDLAGDLKGWQLFQNKSGVSCIAVEVTSTSLRAIFFAIGGASVADRDLGELGELAIADLTSMFAFNDAIHKVNEGAIFPRSPWSICSLEFLGGGAIDIWAPNWLWMKCQSLSVAAQKKPLPILHRRGAAVSNCVATIEVLHRFGELSLSELKDIKVGEIILATADVNASFVAAVEKNLLLSCSLGCSEDNKAIVLRGKHEK